MLLRRTSPMTLRAELPVQRKRTLKSLSGTALPGHAARFGRPGAFRVPACRGRFAVERRDASQRMESLPGDALRIHAPVLVGLGVAAGRLALLKRRRLRLD